MGEIADQMINGEICALCGCYLEPGEMVYHQSGGGECFPMPDNGEGAGFPVVCSGCND
jgi:hypothetical protein